MIQSDERIIKHKLLELMTTAVECCHHIEHEAELLLRERHQLDINAFAELRVWQVPYPVPGSAHSYKYALVYVVAGECVLRYDNEAGEGDHKHLGAVETPYEFTTPAQLLTDFWSEVDQWRRE